MTNTPSISRVVLRNYKSIAHCDVSLGPVTFLVGPNGAGKSNFIEAIRFVSYALSTSLDQAVGVLQGFGMMLRLEVPRPGSISFEFNLRLGQDTDGHYLVVLTSDAEGAYRILREECRVAGPQDELWFLVSEGEVQSNLAMVLPKASEDRFFLTGVSSIPEFGSVLQALSLVAVYNPAPQEMRVPQTAKRYRYVDRSGQNIAQMLFSLQKTNPAIVSRVNEYLSKVSSGIRAVKGVKSSGPYYMLLFSSATTGDDLLANNVSEGTLRALAILTALFQPPSRSGRLTLIGLEEPEAALHPGAAHLLFDAIMEASRSVQIIVTTHSPDLLDRNDVPEGALLAVAQRDGRTEVGPVNHAGLRAMRDGLYTAGELMRMNQLEPESDLHPTS